MSEFTAQEFVSISVSTYDSASLAARLTEHSAHGWSVVSIGQTGTTVTAFLSRPVDTATIDTATIDTATIDTARADTATIDTARADTATIDTGRADTALSSITNDTATAAISTTTTDTASSEPASSAAPAGWYADPAKRFELRYWDGTTWTEYVSRAGEQFTDPPVA